MTFVPLGPDSAIGVRTVFNQECPIFEEKHILCLFAGKNVTVKSGGVELNGKLFWFDRATGGPQHRPCTLIIRTPDGLKHVMRNWEMLKTTEVKTYG